MHACISNLSTRRVLKFGYGLLYIVASRLALRGASGIRLPLRALRMYDYTIFWPLVAEHCAYIRIIRI